MRYSNQGWFRQQVSFLRRQFLQDGALQFSDVLSEGIISQAVTAINGCWVDRIFTPLVTLWVFLGQVLSADQSCRAAVAHLNCTPFIKGTASVLGRDGSLLPGSKAIAGEVLLRRGLFSGTCFGRQGPSSLAVERSASVYVRWHDGHDRTATTASSTQRFLGCVPNLFVLSVDATATRVD